MCSNQLSYPPEECDVSSVTPPANDSAGYPGSAVTGSAGSASWQGTVDRSPRWV
jgi:hypothetical protein